MPFQRATWSICIVHLLFWLQKPKTKNHHHTHTTRFSILCFGVGIKRGLVQSPILIGCISTPPFSNHHHSLPFLFQICIPQSTSTKLTLRLKKLTFLPYPWVCSVVWPVIQYLSTSTICREYKRRRPQPTFYKVYTCFVRPFSRSTTYPLVGAVILLMTFIRPLHDDGCTGAYVISRYVFQVCLFKFRSIHRGPSWYCVDVDLFGVISLLACLFAIYQNVHTYIYMT